MKKNVLILLLLLFPIAMIAQTAIGYGEEFRKQGDEMFLKGDAKGAEKLYNKAIKLNNIIAYNRLLEIYQGQKGQIAEYKYAYYATAKKKSLNKIGMQENEFYSLCDVNVYQTLASLKQEVTSLLKQEIIAKNEINNNTKSQNNNNLSQKSDVDVDIPSSKTSNENTFAVVIANENYQDVAIVQNALNDGEIFAEYCRKTLGLPSSNVTLVKDATLNNLKREINKLQQIAKAYNGTAKIIFYYAGHGVPNESTKDAFLLPVDGFGTDTSTGYSLNELYVTLGRMPAEQIVVLLDACFSGTQRGDGMLASARGVAIKAKPNKVDGKMVVLSAAQGDETAYPYEEQRHGLFTYYLLKKLQQTKGNVSLGDLTTYIKDNVGKKSIVVNGKSQTPNVNPSASLGENWKTWTLK